MTYCLRFAWPIGQGFFSACSLASALRRKQALLRIVAPPEIARIKFLGPSASIGVQIKASNSTTACRGMDVDPTSRPATTFSSTIPPYHTFFPAFLPATHLPLLKFNAHPCYRNSHVLNDDDHGAGAGTGAPKVDSELVAGLSSSLTNILILLITLSLRVLDTSNIRLINAQSIPEIVLVSGRTTLSHRGRGANITIPLPLPPSEIRSKIYHLTLDNTTIDICSPKLHRRRGGPNRTKLVRRLPGILSVNKQIRQESLPLLAHHATLAFSDFFNFSHLLNLVPESFSNLTRTITLRGEVIVTPELLSRFPSLEQVQYTQLGNCVFAPTKENGFNAYASQATNAELVESVKARSASLVLLKEMIWRVNEQRIEGGKGPAGEIQLEAVANVMSSKQRVSLVLNINQRCVLRREVVAEGHFFD